MKVLEDNRPLVLAIDDTPQNLTLIDELLSTSYRIKVAASGPRGLKIAQSGRPPDLILLDLMMPGMDGFEVCRQLKVNPLTRSIPVVFLTASTRDEDEQRGFELGAVDFISKPISPLILKARVRTHLDLKAAADELGQRNNYLEEEVARRTAEVCAGHEIMLVALASMAEMRDCETGKHIVRTQRYVQILARQMSTHPRFVGLLDDETIKLIYQASPLHDLGKIGILDAILLKPGRLTPEEFEIMKTHAALGRDALDIAQQRAGLRLPLLEMAKEMAYTHHEKWDGTGYPQGLAGDDIPLSGRLMAIADVYDALTCRRVYKEPMPHETAVRIMAEGRGTHFDPDILDGFLAMQAQFQAICRSEHD